MTEPIKSEEKVFTPSAILGEPPKHTEENHEGCCYYLATDTMMCTHAMIATGGFYSEDRWLPLKEAAQRIIGYLDHNAMPPKKWVEQLREMTK